MTKLQEAANNEANRLVWWLVGVLTAIVVSLLGAWGKGISSDVDKLKSAVSAIQALDSRLIRVENKLDKVLETKSNGPAY
jgi:hypothetical protein